jgi:hypothetical protein
MPGLDNDTASAAKIKRDLERLMRASARGTQPRAGNALMDAQPLYDLAPADPLMLMGVVIALGRWRGCGCATAAPSPHGACARSRC